MQARRVVATPKRIKSKPIAKRGQLKPFKSTTANSEFVSDNFLILIDTLQKVDTESPLANENAITIADNNGGRIML